MSELSQLGQGSTDYPVAPGEAQIEWFENRYESPYWVEFTSHEMTSVCPKTGQPDFSTVVIRYVPDKRCLESKSLKLYLFSFRNHGIFHEELANKILDDLASALSPLYMEVEAEQRPRGGIGITVTASAGDKPGW